MPSDSRENCTTLASVPTEIDVGWLRLVGSCRALGGHDQHALRLLGLLEGPHPFVALDEDGREHARKQDEVPGGKQRNRPAAYQRS